MSDTLQFFIHSYSLAEGNVCGMNDHEISVHFGDIILLSNWAQDSPTYEDLYSKTKMTLKIL